MLADQFVADTIAASTDINCDASVKDQQDGRANIFELAADQPISNRWRICVTPGLREQCEQALGNGLRLPPGPVDIEPMHAADIDITQ
jgi:hypothetical protein